MASFCKYLLITFFVFIAPIKGMLILISLAVVLDTIFAIYVNVKLYGWSVFCSTKLFNVVVKTFFYMSTILLAFLIDKYILNESLFGVKFLCAKVVTFVWLYIEAKSIDETSVKLGNKPIWQIIKDLLNKTKDLKKDINEITK